MSTHRTPSRILRTLLIVALLSVFAPFPAERVSASCTELHIPTLGLQRCVVPGGQAEIDAGKVVSVSNLTRSNVAWVAAHRSTHGSSFRRLPELIIGDRVRYADVWYKVVEMRIVDRTNPDIDAYFADGPPRLILQTSMRSTLVYTWRAELDPTTPPPVVELCSAPLRFNTRSTQIRALQDVLASQGFYTSRIDGWFYVKTRSAVRAAQRAAGLPATGTLDVATRQALGVCP